MVLAEDEPEVAHIDEEAERLAGDEHRIAAADGVDEQERAAEEREEPEGDRDDRAAGALARDPLHDEAHHEEELGKEAEYRPGV